MLLLLAMKEKVEELTFAPGEDDYRCFIRRSGATHELDPPPPHLHRRIVAATRAIWGCDPHGYRYASGTRITRIAGESAMVDAEFKPGDAGELVELRFRHHAPTAA